MATSDRGFASMDESKQREIASKGEQAEVTLKTIPPRLVKPARRAPQHNLPKIKLRAATTATVASSFLLPLH